jgi:hypothetical protein
MVLILLHQYSPNISSIPVSRVRCCMGVFQGLHQRVHRPRLVLIARRNVGILEWRSAAQVIQTCLPVIVHILLSVVLVEPATNGFGSSKGVLPGTIKILFPFFSVLEALPLSTRGAFKSARRRVNNIQRPKRTKIWWGSSYLIEDGEDGNLP